MLFRVLLPLLSACGLSACRPQTEAGYQPAQAANLMLTRTLHRLLKQHNGSGADSLLRPPFTIGTDYPASRKQPFPALNA